MSAYSDFQRKMLANDSARSARLYPPSRPGDGETNPSVHLSNPYFQMLLETYKHSPDIYEQLNKTPEQKKAVEIWASQHWTPEAQKREQEWEKHLENRKTVTTEATKRHEEIDDIPQTVPGTKEGTVAADNTVSAGAPPLQLDEILRTIASAPLDVILAAILAQLDPNLISATILQLKSDEELSPNEVTPVSPPSQFNLASIYSVALSRDWGDPKFRLDGQPTATSSTTTSSTSRASETQITVARGQIWRSSYSCSTGTFPSQSCPIDALCYCCGIRWISMENFTAGHIRARTKGGSITLDNLRPICQVCDREMGTADMGQFIKAHGYNSLGSRDPKVMSNIKSEETTSIKSPSATAAKHQRKLGF